MLKSAAQYDLLLCILAGNLGQRTGVATGSYAGVLRIGSGIRLCYRLFLLQSGQQQLPQGRPDGLVYQLYDICAGLTRGFRGAGFPSQDHCPAMRC